MRPVIDAINELLAKEPEVSTARIRSVSLSQHWYNKACAYKFVLSTCSNITRLPTTPRAEIGTITHKLLQWSSGRRAKGVTADEAEQKFEELLKKREVELAASPLTAAIAKLSKTCDVFLQRRHAAISHAQRAPRPQHLGNRSSARMYTEESLTSPDGLVSGTMDAVYENGDDIHVVDKKTGSVCERGQIKQAYQEQLYLYAGLTDECLGQMPTSLTLIDGDGARWNVDFSPDQVRSCYRAAKDWLLAVKDEVKNRPNDIQQLAEPRPENCKYCQYRPTCRPYWTASRSCAVGFPSDFASTVCSVNTLPLATVLKFSGYDASLSFRVKSSELPSHPMMAELKPGDKVIIANALMTGRQLEATAQTVVFKDLRG